MIQPTNPFLITGYYSPDFFCDREQETKTMLDALANGRDITLVAPRRMGKTGLICHAFYHLKEQEEEIATFYMDIFATQSLGDFIRLFAHTVLGKLDSAPQQAIHRIGKFIRSCRPVFTFDEFTGAPKVTIDVSPSEETTTLKEIFDYLGSSSKRCYIAIDEFQQITEYPESGVEALLRSYVQFLPNVCFIFAGSKQHVMHEMFTSAKRPFYQSTQLITLDAIDEELYYHFANHFFEEKHLSFPREVFHDIYTKFQGHTWYMQNMLNRLYGYHKEVDLPLVGYALQQITSEMSYPYSDLMKAYSAGHVRLLKAIALEGCVKEVLAGEFIAKHNLRAASSVNSALKKLVDNELVYQTSEGYIIYDRFMGEWLRMQPF